MKKLISLVLAAAVLLSLSVVSFALPFPDVSEKSWYYEDVKWLYDSSKKLMSGFPDTTFRPDDHLTRAQLATVLHSLAGSPKSEQTPMPPFTDIRENVWYTEALSWAYEKGIIKGKSDGRFAPNDAVTRAELATMVVRFISVERLAVKFVHVNPYIPDYESIPDYAKMSAILLYRTEILKGKDGGVFDPKAKTTRAETAALLRRIHTLTSKQEYTLLEKYGLTARADAWINRMPTIIEDDQMPPMFSRFIIMLTLKATEQTPEDLDPKLSLKISKRSGILKIETEREEHGDNGFGFRVTDPLALFALNITDGELLVFEYTVTINGESESYMDYVTVDSAC